MRFATVLAATCAFLAPAAAMAGEVEGTVYNSAGQPAAGVSVSIAELGLSATTGDDGAYRFADLEAGEHFIIARAQGASAQRVAVQVGQSGETQRNIMLMSRMAVRAVTGAPADAAQQTASFAQARELAEQMLSTGPARGEVAWRWNDLDG